MTKRSRALRYGPIRHNRLDLLKPEARELAEAECRRRAKAATRSVPVPPCVETGHVCYHCQDFARARLAAHLGDPEVKGMLRDQNEASRKLRNETRPQTQNPAAS
jgi:hypothetical protein